MRTSVHIYTREMVHVLRASIDCNAHSDCSALEVALEDPSFSHIKTKEDAIQALRLLEKVKALKIEPWENAWDILFK